jgi:hypothetical protein
VNYILKFYAVILEKYHSAQGNKDGKKGFGFLDCANCAVKSFNDSHAGGIITNGRTLLRWHQTFRSNCRFEHPLANWKTYEPTVFQAFPMMKLQVKQDLDAMVNQESFNTDIAMEYFRTTFVDRLGYCHQVAIRNYYQEEVSAAKEKGDKFPKARHMFQRDDGVLCHEFCVLDDVAAFLPYCHSHRDQDSPFLCKLSVRKDPNKRPLITLGQDEAIMNQYVFASSTWHDSQGSAKIRPKSLGDGIMLSAFTGFVIGFGGADLPELTEEIIAAINIFRTGEHSKYQVPSRQRQRRLLEQRTGGHPDNRRHRLPPWNLSRCRYRSLV